MLYVEMDVGTHPVSDEPTRVVNLNLKISEEEKWAFKELCVRHRLTQVDGFRLAATLLEKHLDGKDRDALRGAKDKDI